MENESALVPNPPSGSQPTACDTRPTSSNVRIGGPYHGVAYSGAVGWPGGIGNPPSGSQLSSLLAVGLVVVAVGVLLLVSGIWGSVPRTVAYETIAAGIGVAVVAAILIAWSVTHR